jgi:hypothetical protein
MRRGEAVSESDWPGQCNGLLILLLSSFCKGERERVIEILLCAIVTDSA